MNSSTKKLLCLRMLVLALAVSFGFYAQAETSREELTHAYRLLKLADHDYDGHRGAAMKELELAGKDLGLVLEGDSIKRERQWKSDEKLIEARRLLRESRDKLEERDRVHAAARIEKAIKEIDIALNVK